ncbi:MAG: DUF2971 domain-containing protein [Bacteroidetes bacterium]|nr:DUF2971 domain-containing protein [Bacteroidota bacterium]
MEKYGWQYNITGDQSNLKMEVIPPKDKIKPLPETLFKIYPLNSYSIDALLNSYIYGSHPSEFNDLFDCHKDLIEYDDITVIRKILSMKLGENHEFLLRFDKEENIKLFGIELFYLLLYSTFGIYCMSDDINNITIWSNYCNHNGFAVEFEIEKLKSDLVNNGYKPFGPFQVNYQNEIEKVSLIKNLSESIPYQTNIKSKSWENDNEWRLLIESLYKPLEIPEKEIDKLILPKEFEHLENPIKLLKCIKTEKRKFNITINSIRSIRLSLDFFKKEVLNRIIENDSEVIVNLKDGNKICVLNFIFEHSIDLYISLPNNQKFQIDFERYEIEKIKLNEFKLTKIK